ncbi:MAG TPA: O-antigen ligase family protein [Terriglobales bacterium]|nr:O-antigen ligase family protein [Terriglobales bacterium]
MLSLRRTISVSVVWRGAALLMLFPTAAFLGWAIAHEFWLVAAAVLFVPFFFVWPVEIALGMFAFLVPFEAVAMFSGSATLPFLAGAIAGAGLLAVGFIDHRFEKPPRAAIWWTLFVALAVASYLWAYNPPSVYGALPTLLGLFLVYLAAVSIRISPKELSWVTTLAIAGGVLASIMSASAFYQGQTFTRAARSTIMQDGRESDPNYYAAALLLPLALAVGDFLSAKGVFRRVAMAAGAGVITIAILLTMSRGALLAVIVMIIVYSIRYRLTWKIVAPIAILAGGLAIVPDLFFSRLGEAAESGGAGRLDIWIAGLNALKHYAFFGGGFNNFPSVYAMFSGYAPTFRGYDRDAHNMYLALAVELGIPGLVCLGMALYTQFREAWPPKIKEQAIKLMAVPAEAGCCAVLAASFFLNPIMRKSLWLALIMFALSIKARQSQEAKLKDREEPEDDVRATLADEEGRVTRAALAVGPFSK